MAARPRSRCAASATSNAKPCAFEPGTAATSRAWDSSEVLRARKLLD
jgi:hypothetical protein